MIVLAVGFHVTGMDALTIMRAILSAMSAEGKMTFTTLREKSFVQSVSSEGLKK